MANSPTIFDEPHHQSLELLCARALASGDVATAFRLADRRCRIPPLPEPHCYVLRAEALFRMGEKTAAVADLTKALEIAPDDVAANRRMLAWGRGKPRLAAAASLIVHDRDFDVLNRAVRALRGPGPNAFANLRVLDRAVEGWAAWEEGDSIAVTIAGEGNSVTTELAADPAHPLAGALKRAVNIKIPRAARGVQTITVAADGNVVTSLRTPRIDTEAPGRLPVVSDSAAHAAPTVIVPVYADFAATKACLDSLLPSAGASYRVVIVNDATPEARIEKLVAQAARRPGVLLVNNPANLGFVGSVNRALEHAGGGDIVLLNADTVVPAGFAERLAEAAHAASDIGTVTPLSNNGEFTSFPVANKVNPLPSAADIAALDDVAARVNAGKVADIPNGIGFCLYITRECLDAVGALSEHYHRGYLEDVDFCLRARELGFRNVCAPSVFVGHVGSRSFGAEKRSLVVRNLAAVERRFPNYRAECAAFVMADPLRPYRAAIEQALPTGGRRPRLLVTGAGSVADVVRVRARLLHAAGGDPVLIVTLRPGPQGTIATVKDSGEAAPQSLRFALSREGERRDLLAYLRRAGPQRIEFANPCALPETIAADLMALNAPYDILAAGGGLRSAGDAGQMWHKLVTGAANVYAPDRDAEAFAASLLPSRDVIRLPPSDGRGRASRRRRRSAGSPLGIVSLRGSAREQQFLHAVVQRLKEAQSELAVTLVGRLPNDLDLMRFDDVFVTGPVEAAELPEVARAYGLRALFLCSCEPLFGHPLQSAAAACGLPVAAFDWSGRRNCAAAELALDPHAPAAAIADALAQWVLQH